MGKFIVYLGKQFGISKSLYKLIGVFFPKKRIHFFIEFICLILNSLYNSKCCIFAVILSRQASNCASHTQLKLRNGTLNENIKASKANAPKHSYTHTYMNHFLFHSFLHAMSRCECC